MSLSTLHNASCAVRDLLAHHFLLFFFNDTATTEIYTLSLHDALPICIGIDATWPLATATVQQAGRFAASAQARFQDAGYEVQTTRLALSPFAELRSDDEPSWVVPF